MIDGPALRTVHDVVTQSDVGMPGPFGRERVVEALPSNKNRGAVQLAAAQVLHDAARCYLADPDGNLVGVDGKDYQLRWSATDTSGNVFPRTALLLCAQTS